MNFNTDFEWHDAIIRKIVIDRNDPGNIDTISFEIIWPDETESRVVFENVYWANLNMNFGVIASESIRTAFETDESDPNLLDVYTKWKGFLDGVQFNCYQIETNSTASIIKIVAERFLVL